MPQATTTPATPPGAAPTSRRVTVGAFLALAANAKAGAIPMPTPDPDAALHAAVAAFRAADDGISLDNLTDDDADPALTERWMALVGAISATEPRTLAGLIAKTQATRAAMVRYLGGTWGDPEPIMAESLALDVLRVLGAEPWPEHPAIQELRERQAAWRAAREGAAA